MKITALRLFFARVALGWPFVAPPGVPAERVTMLRKTFDDTLKDPEFIKGSKLQDLNVDATGSQELAEIIASVYKTLKDLVRRTAQALGHVSKSDTGN